MKKMYEIYEEKLGVDLNHVFLGEFSRFMQVSEFLLYDVAIAAQGLDLNELYKPVPRLSQTLWGGYYVGPAALEVAFNHAL